MICARDAASWWPSNANSQSGSFIEHLSQKKPSSKERPGKPRDVVSWLTNFLSRNPEQQNGHVLKCRSAVLVYRYGEQQNGHDLKCDLKCAIGQSGHGVGNTELYSKASSG